MGQSVGGDTRPSRHACRMTLANVNAAQAMRTSCRVMPRTRACQVALSSSQHVKGLQG